jgi:hypothetical protein
MPSKSVLKNFKLYNIKIMIKNQYNMTIWMKESESRQWKALSTSSEYSYNDSHVSLNTRKQPIKIYTKLNPLTWVSDSLYLITKKDIPYFKCTNMDQYEITYMKRINLV